jgi:ribonucleoside-diphosphate reductase beta chain
MATMTYTLFSRAGCWGCDRAKELLAGADVVVVDCAGSPARAIAARGLAAVPGRATDTYPQIFAGDVHVGGLPELERLLAARLGPAEPALAPSAARFTAFPIEHPRLWDCYKRAVASFWTADEINLSKDAAEWPELTDSERHFVRLVLAFFASSDGIVQENLAANFLKEIQLAEARQFFSYQIFNEAIHNETYSLLIDALIRDPAEKAATFAAITDLEPVRAKAAWALKWLDASRPFAERLVAFACVEGILFSGSFCAVYWLKTRGLMPGLGLSNQFISRDEAMHCEFGCLLYRDHVRHKLPEARLHEIIGEAVANETAFITEAVPCDLIGMSPGSMAQYVRFVADRLAAQLGYAPLYRATNPFPWMELISLSAKDNFFERFSSEYQKSGVLAGSSGQVFALDAAF